jgi:LacI family transcriptional regulator
MTATIYDVARLAGVSTATVSRVVNGYKVSPKLRTVVESAVDALGFVPNRTARSLRRRSSSIIALILPDMENPFFAAVARGVEDVARRSGYSLVLCNTDDDAEAEARHLQVAVSEGMAGVVLAPTRDDVHLSSIVDLGVPMVALDRTPRNLSVDAVIADNMGGGRRSTDLLLALGFTRVACITGPQSTESARARAAGWREAMTSAGLQAPAHRVQYENYRASGGYAATRALLQSDEPPDALFVANNLMAVGAIQALTDAGVAPPDVGVVSFGALPYGLAFEGVFSVELPARAMGEAAAGILLSRINGDSAPAKVVVVS